tara:strand:+ start:435 stop:686 length:252 start_codon:yes stop_codon:yes gene_type:complete
MKYINTDNLTVINYGDGEGKLMIFNRTKSPYGYNPRNLIVSLFGRPLKEITYNYIQKQVDKVYSTFNYEEIDEIINKINNESK